MSERASAEEEGMIGQEQGMTGQEQGIVLLSPHPHSTRQLSLCPHTHDYTSKSVFFLDFFLILFQRALRMLDSREAGDAPHVLDNAPNRHQFASSGAAMGGVRSFAHVHTLALEAFCFLPWL